MQTTLATSVDKKQLIGLLVRPLQTILWVVMATLFTLGGLVMILVSVVVVAIPPLKEWQSRIASSFTRQKRQLIDTTRSRKAKP